MFKNIKQKIAKWFNHTIKPIFRLLLGPAVIVTVDVLCLTIGPAFIAGAILGGVVLSVGVFTAMCNMPDRTTVKICDFVSRYAGVLDYAILVTMFVTGLCMGGVTIALVLGALGLQLSLLLGGIRLMRCFASDVRMNEVRHEMGIPATA
jgi:hypothetical protein